MSSKFAFRVLFARFRADIGHVRFETTGQEKKMPVNIFATHPAVGNKPPRRPNNPMDGGDSVEMVCVTSPDKLIIVSVFFEKGLAERRHVKEFIAAVAKAFERQFSEGLRRMRTQFDQLARTQPFNTVCNLFVVYILFFFFFPLYLYYPPCLMCCTRLVISNQFMFPRTCID